MNWITRKNADPLDALRDTVSRFALLVDGDGAAGGGDGSNGAAGANGVGGDGSGGASSGDGGSAAGPNWEGFTSSLENLNASLGGGLNTLIEEVRGMKPAPAPEPAPDFESMSQGELAAHIIGAVTKAVETKLGERLAPVVDAVNGIQRSTSEREINEQVRQLQSNKDFNDWKPAMLELAKQPKYQTLDVVDLYALAKSKNPTRAAELEKKYAAPVEPPKPRWGGLTGGTVSVPARGGEATPVNGRDASIEAYKEVAARHSHVLRALEN
jgi:hypothetical protein